MTLSTGSLWLGVSRLLSPPFSALRFCCSRLTLCTVGNPLTSSTGRSHSCAISEVVAPVALLSGIALSPEIPVRYVGHRRKVVISLRSPSLVFSVWVYPSFSRFHGFVGLHPTAFSPWLAPYCPHRLASVPSCWSRVGIWHGCVRAGELLLFLGVS